MGCGASKQEEPSQALLLCRSRCQHLSDAVRLRYSLADAHAAYLVSLDALASSLHRFFLPGAGPAPPSPALILPHPRKGDLLAPSLPPPAAAAAAAAIPHHSRGSSGHIPSLSSTDDEDDMRLHSDDDEELVTTTTTTTKFHFAKKGPPAASVAYEQPSFGAELGQVQFGTFGPGPGDGAAYPYLYPDPYAGQGSGMYAAPDTAYPYSYPYAYQGFGGGFFGSAAQPAAPAPAPAQPAPPRPPPDPPSPPKASTWEFLNPFETYEGYFQNYTPSRSSRELREEEGIPDLEDEEQEVVKEAYGDPKASTSSAGGVGGRDADEERSHGVAQEQHYKVGNAGQNGEFDVHVVGRSVALDEVGEGKLPEGLAQQRNVVPGIRSVPDVLQEIVDQFQKAKMTGQDVSKMLEVGKFQYHQKKFQVVSSRMKYMTPSISTLSSSVPSISTSSSSAPSASKSSEFSDIASSVRGDMDEERAMQAGNLSSTLQKLYIWEKKLLDEVKVEEDMRLLHESKCKKLRRLDEQGAEPYKIDATRHKAKKLATKTRIAIQIIHSISVRISKLRDEELWPEVRELIHGLLNMWQVLTKCHHSQHQAVLEAKTLDAIFHAAHPEATMVLILELLRWSESFSNWVDIQKSFVNELNEWLKKCLPDEREVTADGVAPFSPGRLGAPPVFVICNFWANAINMISEADVVKAMNTFTTNVLFVWRQYYSNGLQHIVSPNVNKGLKTLERDNQNITKAVEAVNKKRTQVGNRGGYSHTREIILMDLDASAKTTSLHTSLLQLFEAMQRFTENSLDVYERLDLRCNEEENAARGGVRT